MMESNPSSVPPLISYRSLVTLVIFTFIIIYLAVSLYGDLKKDTVAPSRDNISGTANETGGKTEKVLLMMGFSTMSFVLIAMCVLFVISTLFFGPKRGDERY
jgi:hypothetical protein